MADSGNGRIVALDTTSGFEDGEIVEYEILPTNLRMSGATVTEVVSPGTLEVPSGLTLEEDVLFATDHATGHISPSISTATSSASYDCAGTREWWPSPGSARLQAT